jgi:predicted ATPase/HPt (histidine-containing phosphotransfer) domain-containing protein
MSHVVPVVERYEVGETVARSPRTTVRRARRKSDGCRVVLKSLTREYPSRREIGQLEFEYRILRKLALPGTVRAWDLERDGDRRVMVLEDFGGEALRPGGNLDRFFAVALPLARTVGQVHERGVIHKDIKPENVLVNDVTGEVKLIDFNIASELTSEHRDMRLAAPLEGSLPYISPEQTGRMNRDLDYRTDHYSLGITFFELLTGALPYHAEDSMGWVHCHLSRAVPDVRELNPAVPEALALIVRKLMAKDPGHRYQSAHGLLVDLETCRRGWVGGGCIESFALGRQDVPERFQVSQKLFGREQELAALQEALGTASHSAGMLLLVAGYSGVGKSSLINELQRSIVGQRGSFIAGKLDQLERNVPYGPLVQALRGLVRQLLAEPEARLEAWRREICAALGSEGRVLTDLIPELEQVIGAQPRVAELDPREAYERLRRVFRDLVRGVSRPEHPLVVFIDDLQWTDASTPELLVSLLGADPVQHLLVIGAYRDNEVSDGHLLAVALRRLEAERPASVRRLHLQPLGEENVNQLIADTLRCQPAASAPLAQLIAEKTGGNPFFVNELLGLLYRQRAFRFLPDEGRWQWDQQRVEAAAVTGNVLDLLLERLRSLPSETVEHLRWAACLGAEFHLETLARVSEEPPALVAETLMHAVQARILVPLGGDYRLVDGAQGPDSGAAAPLAVRYRFQHDRVQQAAYALLEGAQRASAHLKIGWLLRRAPGGDRDEHLFEVVNHLNLGRALIADRAERLELARLDHAAGLRAKGATAYVIAASYFQVSLDLRTGEDAGPSSREPFETRSELALCVFLAGEVERALAMCDDLLARAPDRRSRAEAYALRVLILQYQARMPEAIETLRQALGELGVELPRDPADIDRRIGEGIGTLLAHLERVPIARIPELPEMADEERVLVMGLLSRLVVAALQVCPPLFVLAELILFDLALSHGVTEVSCKNFADCGIILGGMLGDTERAYALARAAFALLKRYEPSALAAGVHFVFGGNVSGWRAPLREAFAELAEAQRLAIQTGDVPHHMFALLFEQALAFTIGRDLDECWRESRSVVAFMQKARAVGHVAWVETVGCAIARLQGAREEEVPGGAREEREGSAGAAPAPEALAELLRGMGNGPALFMHGQRQALVCLLLDEAEEGARWEALAEEMAMAGSGLQEMPLLVLCRALRRADGYPGAPPDERTAIRAAVQADADKLAGWAAGCPENFAHKHLFLLAELARIDAAPADQVAELYGQAVRAAGVDYAHVRALAHERHAAYWEGKRQPRIARSFFEEAYYTYERWGARAKLRQMEHLRPEWVRRTFEPDAGAFASTGASRSTLASRTSANLGASLDVASVVKATQAISGEVKPERLYARLMSTIIENAGAQRGCLVLGAESGGELRVEAQADVAVHSPSAEAATSLPIDQCTQLCAEVVRYVARTLDPVVVDDAALERVHPTAAYAKRSGAKSILCVPVLQRGTLIAILYAENSAITHAFTPARVSLLQVIASQAAISITNARLYETLEDKVTERTRALAEKNQEVLAMLHGMQQGVFIIDEALRIQPGYSPHLARLLGTDDLAGRDCLALLFGGSNIGPDAVAATKAALVMSIGSAAFLAEANSANLVRELERTGPGGERQSWELDWTPILAEAVDAHGDADVLRFLVVVRDVTLLRQLSRSAAENARQLDMVGQILDAGVDTFRNFARSSRAAMTGALDRLRAGGPLTGPVINELFREVHTLKGNARLLGLSHLVDTVHVAESAYDELRGTVHPEAGHERLIAGTESVLADLGGYEDVFSAKLADLARPEDRASASFGEIRALVDRLTAGGIDAPEFAAAVSAAVARAEAVPLEALVRECARMLPSIAGELGKPAPTVACAGVEALLAPAWARILEGVLVHALRNAVDHGLEPPDERRSQGKPEQGQIKVTVVPGRASGGVTVRLRDDGRGLRLDRLRAQALGAAATDEEVAERVFLPGVSTAERVSTLSGRGVGMDAIRAFVRAQGGDARIELTGVGRDGCRPFDLVLELPPGALVG